MFILETNACENFSFLATLLFIKKIIKILSYIVPAILILLLTIDMSKAVVAGNDDDIKKAQKISFKRIIASLIIFFVPLLVQVSFNMLGDNGGTWIKCFNDATDENVDKLVKEQQEKDKQKQDSDKQTIEDIKKKNKENKESQKQKREQARENDKQKKETNSGSNGGSITNTGKIYKGKAKLNKTYSSVKILDTISKSDFGIRSTVTSTSGVKIAQSFAVVNNYYVVVHNNTLNTKAYVGVYDKHTNKKVNNFSTSLGHANGTTHNSKTDKIYVTHGALSRSKVHYFSASSIGSKKSISVKSTNVSRSVSGVAYDDSTGKLYYASGNGIYEYSGGSMKHRVTRKSFLFGSSQDFCVHNGIVYDTRTNGGNTIDIYKVSGGYLGSYRVKISGHEIESIDYYGEGNKMAVLFNHYGSKNNYVYVIDSIIPQ